MTEVNTENKDMNIGQYLGTRHPKTSQRGMLATDKSGVGSALQTMTHSL